MFFYFFDFKLQCKIRVICLFRRVNPAFLGNLVRGFVFFFFLKESLAELAGSRCGGQKKKGAY